MTDAANQREIKTPGPFWLWLVATIAFGQIGKRVFTEWKLPEQFTFGSRFLDNLVVNILWGLPVLFVLVVVTICMNRGNTADEDDL